MGVKLTMLYVSYIYKLYNVPMLYANKAGEKGSLLSAL